MKALKFTITLREPVLMSSPVTGEENSSVSQVYLPGSALRGAAIRAWQEYHHQPFNIADARLRSLFFRGGFSFLNAYPNHPGSQAWDRSLPCPLSWMNYKDEDKEQVYDLALRPPEENKTVKGVKPGYFWYRNEEDTFEGWTVKLQNIVHNASLNRNRKRVGDSTVYRYESIPAGDVYAGVVLSASGEDLLQLKTWLESIPLLMGGSHTAGYGLVELCCEEDITDWEEYQQVEEEEEEPDGRLRLTLLSDTILRGPDGQTTGDLCGWLSARLGRGIRPEKAFCRLGLASGYNRKAGMPLPQDWALQAGSTFVFAAGQITRDMLNSWKEHGIGERRVEGFGRVAVDLNRRAGFTMAIIDERPVTFARPVALSEASQQLARQTAQRILRARLDERLVWAINHTELTRPRPKNAQLERLRDAASQAAARQDLSMITRHIAQLKDAAKQLERCRVNGGQRLIDWLRACAETPKIPEEFGWEDIRLPVVAGARADITTALKIEYTTRFLEGLFRKTVRNSVEGGER